MSDLLTPEWIQTMVAATAQRENIVDRDCEPVTVAFTIGKTKRAELVIDGGRVVGPVTEEATVDVTIPVTAKQLSAVTEGSLSLAKAYMRGDIKPEGSSRALLRVVEVFDDLALSRTHSSKAN